MGGRKWSKEELERLEDLSGKYPLSNVARLLGRSENAVYIKQQRLGIGGFLNNTDMISRNMLSKIMGVEGRTVMRWERHGLKRVNKRPYVMFRQEDIIKFLKSNQSEWNAARVTDDTLFMQAEWYQKKRKTDISHKYNWQSSEVSKLHFLRKQGFSIREIAEKMNRSESSIKYKLYEGNRKM